MSHHKRNLLIIIITTVMLTACGIQPYENPSGLVTIQQYNKLEQNMAFGEVIDMLGPPHMINFEENTDDDVEVKDDNTIYTWDGVAPESSIMLQFQDKRLYTKYKNGLD